MLKVARRAILIATIALSLLFLAHWIAACAGYRIRGEFQLVMHSAPDRERVLTMRLADESIGFRMLTIRNPGLRGPPQTKPGWYDHDTLPWTWRVQKKLHSIGTSQARGWFDRFAMRHYTMAEVGFEAFSGVWAVILGTPGIVWVLRNNRRWLRMWRERRARPRGICPTCGYDLRASRERCPECGTPIPAEVVSVNTT